MLRESFEIPEGSIYHGGVAVCQYLAPDGSMAYGYVYDTQDLPLSTTLGLLEMAKLDIHGVSNDVT